MLLELEACFKYFIYICVLYIIYIFNIYKLYLILAPSNKLFWKLSCVAIEKQRVLWKQQDSMEKLIIANAQYSTIDALLLMHVGSTLFDKLQTPIFIKNNIL